MKRIVAVVLLSILAAGQVHADWDPELEAREQRAREAAAREQAARDAEAKKLKDAAEAKAHANIMAEKRRYVGAAAAGKSDAEVARLYDEKQARTAGEAHAVAAEAQRKVNTPEARAATKDVTGYSMEEMSRMSDAELEVLQREMEQKYGNGN
ncbi:MAG: hypothetical protein AB7O49_09660 [Sphingomonadales bacterium]